MDLLDETLQAPWENVKFGSINARAHLFNGNS